MGMGKLVVCGECCQDGVFQFIRNVVLEGGKIVVGKSGNILFDSLTIHKDNIFKGNVV